MAEFTLNEGRARELAGAIVDLAYRPDSFEKMTPFPGDPFRERHFIFFLAAIDHNTHGAERYEAQLAGAPLHGSDLMYALASRAAKKDPDTFTPARLVQVTVADLVELFRTAEGRLPVGLARRAELLRDAAQVLCCRYQGDLAHLFDCAGGCLRREEGPGILALLGEIRAYQDPLEKKSFLLIKLLKRRGLLEVRDPQRLKVPVDHVLFTAALRSGLVLAGPEAARFILEHVPLPAGMLQELRERTLEAYDLVAAFSGLPADHFDDLVWAYGRECQKFPAPLDAARLEEIRILLDARVASPAVRDAFLIMLNGLDPGAPAGTARYPVPAFPDTWYF